MNIVNYRLNTIESALKDWKFYNEHFIMTGIGPETPLDGAKGIYLWFIAYVYKKHCV